MFMLSEFAICQWLPLLMGAVESVYSVDLYHCPKEQTAILIDQIIIYYSQLFEGFVLFSLTRAVRGKKMISKLLKPLIGQKMVMNNKRLSMSHAVLH